MMPFIVLAETKHGEDNEACQCECVCVYYVLRDAAQEDERVVGRRRRHEVDALDAHRRRLLLHCVPRLQHVLVQEDLQRVQVSRHLLLELDVVAHLLGFVDLVPPVHERRQRQPVVSHLVEVGVGVPVRPQLAREALVHVLHRVDTVEDEPSVVLDNEPQSGSTGWGQIVRAVLQLNLLGVMVWYINMVLPAQCPADTF